MRARNAEVAVAVTPTVHVQRGEQRSGVVVAGEDHVIGVATVPWHDSVGDAERPRLALPLAAEAAVVRLDPLVELDQTVERREHVDVIAARLRVGERQPEQRRRVQLSGRRRGGRASARCS